MSHTSGFYRELESKSNVFYPFERSLRERAPEATHMRVCNELITIAVSDEMIERSSLTPSELTRIDTLNVGNLSRLKTLSVYARWLIGLELALNSSHNAFGVDSPAAIKHNALWLRNESVPLPTPWSVLAWAGHYAASLDDPIRAEVLAPGLVHYADGDTTEDPAPMADLLRAMRQRLPLLSNSLPEEVARHIGTLSSSHLDWGYSMNRHAPREVGAFTGASEMQWTRMTPSRYLEHLVPPLHKPIGSISLEGLHAWSMPPSWALDFNLTNSHWYSIPNLWRRHDALAQHGLKPQPVKFTHNPDTPEEHVSVFAAFFRWNHLYFQFDRSASGVAACAAWVKAYYLALDRLYELLNSVSFADFSNMLFEAEVGPQGRLRRLLSAKREREGRDATSLSASQKVKQAVGSLDPADITSTLLTGNLGFLRKDS